MIAESGPVTINRPCIRVKAMLIARNAAGTQWDARIRSGIASGFGIADNAHYVN